MVSIRKLERMLQPYWVESGAASAYHDYEVYKKGGIKVRVEGLEPLERSLKRYKAELENAARTLGLT